MVAIWDGLGVRYLDVATGKEVRRIQVQRFGWDSIDTLQFSSNGKFIVLTHDTEMVVCNAVTGNILTRSKKGVGIRPRRMSFSADGKLLAVGAFDFRPPLAITLMDVTPTLKVKRFAGPQVPKGDPALSPDGNRLVCWGISPSPAVEPFLQIWDVATGKKLHQLECEDEITQAIFSPDSKLLLVLDRGSALGIWDVAQGKLLRRFMARRKTESALAWSPDGKRVATGTEDGVVQVWDLTTNRRMAQCDGPARTRVTSLVFLPGNKALAAGVCNHAVRLWEVPSGLQLTPTGGHDSAVATLAFSSDGKTLISGGTDGICFWEVQTGRELRRFKARAGRAWRRSSQLLYQLSPRGQYLLWGSGAHNALHAVDLVSGQEVARLPWPTVGLDEWLSALSVFAADRPICAVFSPTPGQTERGAVRVYHLETGEEKSKIEFAEWGYIFLALSPDARTLAVVIRSGQGDSRRAVLLLVDLETGKQLGKLGIAGGWPTGVAFSPDGSLVAVASGEGIVRLWDVNTNKEISSLGDRVPGNVRDRYPDPGVIAFSRDGRTLAVVSNPNDKDSKILIWELASARVRARLAGHRGNCASLAFSPNGRLLATGGADTTVLLWDLIGRTASVNAHKRNLTTADLNRLWADLDSADALNAHRAMARLTLAPQQAVALFRRELKPAAGKILAEKEVKRLIDNLGDDSFEVREKAIKALEKAGRTVRPLLLAALKASKDLEKKRRLEELLRALTPSAPVPELIRPTRALEVLERLATPEARRLLDELSRGNPSARLTTDAAATLRRLAQVRRR
jgi:WD40 repeat protein